MGFMIETYDFFKGIEREQLVSMMHAIVFEHGYGEFSELYPDGEHIDKARFLEAFGKAFMGLDEKNLGWLDSTGAVVTAEISDKLNKLRLSGLTDFIFVHCCQHGGIFRLTVDGKTRICKLNRFGIKRSGMNGEDHYGLMFNVRQVTLSETCLREQEYFIDLWQLALNAKPEEGWFSFNGYELKLENENGQNKYVEKPLRITVEKIASDDNTTIDSDDNSNDIVIRKSYGYAFSGYLDFGRIKIDDNGWLVYMKDDIVLHREKCEGTEKEKYAKAVEWLVNEEVVEPGLMPEYEDVVRQKDVKEGDDEPRFKPLLIPPPIMP